MSAGDGCCGPSRASAKHGVKVLLEASVGCVEELPTGNHHNVDTVTTCQGSTTAKDLSNQPFSSIPANGIPQFSRRDDSKSRGTGLVGCGDDRHIAAIG